MQPGLLLDHAERLLHGEPDEADIRRAISACCYALFNLLTLEAADRLIATEPPIRAVVRRSFDHRTIARVCVGLLSSPSARPRWLNDIIAPETPPSLALVATTFIELQVARQDADYALDKPVSLHIAESWLASARDALDAWSAARTTPAARTFLLALHLHDRLTRRG